MPFAGYKDFADCVSRNRDKGDPDAYCGSIKHEVEDKSLGTAVALADLSAVTTDLAARMAKQARTYLRPGQKPPKGVSVQQGPHGGKYYEGGPSGGLGQKPPVKNYGEGGPAFTHAPSDPRPEMPRGEARPGVVGSFKGFAAQHGVVTTVHSGQAVLEVRDRKTGELVAFRRYQTREDLQPQAAELMRDAYRKVKADEARKEVGRRRGDFSEAFHGVLSGLRRVFAGEPHRWTDEEYRAILRMGLENLELHAMQQAPKAEGLGARQDRVSAARSFARRLYREAREAALGGENQERNQQPRGDQRGGPRRRGRGDPTYGQYRQSP